MSIREWLITRVQERLNLSEIALLHDIKNLNPLRARRHSGLTSPHVILHSDWLIFAIYLSPFYSLLRATLHR